MSDMEKEVQGTTMSLSTFMAEHNHNMERRTNNGYHQGSKAAMLLAATVNALNEANKALEFEEEEAESDMESKRGECLQNYDQPTPINVDDPNILPGEILCTYLSELKYEIANDDGRVSASILENLMSGEMYENSNFDMNYQGFKIHVDYFNIRNTGTAYLVTITSSNNNIIDLDVNQAVKCRNETYLFNQESKKIWPGHEWRFQYIKADYIYKSK